MAELPPLGATAETSAAAAAAVATATAVSSVSASASESGALRHFLELGVDDLLGFGQNVDKIFGLG